MSSESRIWNTLIHKEVVEVSGGPTSATDQKYGNFGNLLPDTPISRHLEINQDPAGYINGADMYQFLENNPVWNVDPERLSIIGFVYRVTPTDGSSYVGSAVQLGERLTPTRPYFSIMTDPTNQITAFPVDAGLMPATRAELNRALSAMEQEGRDQTGNFGRPELCNLRRAATPDNKDQRKMDFDLNTGDPADIPNLDPAQLDNLDSMFGTGGMLTSGDDELAPLLTHGSIDITALPGETAASDEALDLLPVLLLGE